MDDAESQLVVSDQLACLRNKALELLARREHSTAELEQKLQQKLPSQYNATLIPSLLSDLCEQGVLSDDRFTEAYVNMRARKGYGPSRIAMELSEKGISPDMASAYLQERQDWNVLLQSAWQKKFRTYPDSYAEKAKQMRFLQYRGFPAADISRFLDAGGASDEEM